MDRAQALRWRGRTSEPGTPPGGIPISCHANSRRESTLGIPHIKRAGLTLAGRRTLAGGLAAFAGGATTWLIGFLSGR